MYQVFVDIYLDWVIVTQKNVDQTTALKFLHIKHIDKEN